MNLVRSPSWHTAPNGDPRGYIETERLRELWFHTGTACNLACPFCLEGSKPGDTRLGLITLQDVQPFIDEAVELGVEQFSFTGGEPFVAKDIVKILQQAAQHRPCLVLTNGTDALQARLDEIQPMRGAKNSIAFRISIDYPDAARHDAGRGTGNFLSALTGLKQLHEMGFNVSVARQMDPDEDRAAIETAYHDLFRAHDLPADMTLVSFPDFATPGSMPDVPHVTTNCMTTYQTAETRAEFMCSFSRMIVKQNGRMRVYACTLVDDDVDYDLGDTLADSLAPRISLKHHRCYSCFAYGSSCSEL